MDFHISNDWRNRRAHLNSFPPSFGPMHYSMANYSTETMKKSDLTEIITSDPLLNSLHCLENPLRKNLADTFFKNPVKTPENMMSKQLPEDNFSFRKNSDSEVKTPNIQHPTLSLFTRFMSRLINSITEPFVSQRRVVEPPTQFYDCIHYSDSEQKDSGFEDYYDPHDTPSPCPPNQPIDIKNRVIIEKKNTIVDHNNRKDLSTNSSFEDIFVDAFTNEDFQVSKIGFVELPEVIPDKTEINNQLETTDIAVPLPDLPKTENCINIVNNSENMKHNKRSHGKSIPNNKIHCKKFKNPNRTTEKRKSTNLNKIIQEDFKFANEMDIQTVDESPTIPESHTIQFGCFFDEIQGRFKSNSLTESEDSFQIVFSDSPTQISPRCRKVSDCDSEDSFIIFEGGSEDNCYSTQDVFGDSDYSDNSDSEDSESDSDDYDSHDDENLYNCSVANLSRTISDLTDEGLYEDAVHKSRLDEDEVDCAFVMDLDEINEKCKENGVMMNRYKKMIRRRQPPKKVTFTEAPPKVHVLRVWAFAARQARPGHWQRVVLDRERFTRRIADVDMAISWVLKPQHRARVKFQRFMPWWHAQRRLEVAEKKAKDDQAKVDEEQAKLDEEQAKINEEQDKLDKEQATLDEQQATFDEEQTTIDEERAKNDEKPNIGDKQNLKEKEQNLGEKDQNEMVKEKQINNKQGPNKVANGKIHCCNSIDLLKNKTILNHSQEKKSNLTFIGKRKLRELKGKDLIPSSTSNILQDKINTKDLKANHHCQNDTIVNRTVI